MTAALTRYEAARSALAEARSIDEVKDVLDKAEALRAYGRMANDLQLEIDAAEIRMRAERRLGILLDEAKREGRLREGRPRKVIEVEENGTSTEPFSLADIGVDKKLSSRAQKVGGIAERAFEGMIARMRDRMADGNRRVSLDLIKEDEADKRRAEAEAHQYAGGKVDDLAALAASGFRAGAILADPAWYFVTRSEKGDGRSASVHYRTEGLAAMMALPVRDLAADDCVLFMWMVDWCPADALALIEAWGFTHKTTAFTWVKEMPGQDLAARPAFFMGQGYWTRANPEDCWLATRGAPKRLHADVRQLLVAPVMEHSRKPDEIHNRIERLVGGPYLELFARRPRDKWLTWGNETPFVMPAALPPHDPETGELMIEGRGGQKEESRRDGTHLAEPAPAGARGVGDVSPLAVENGQAPVAVPSNPAHEPGSGRAPEFDPDDDLDIPKFLRVTNPESAWRKSQEPGNL